MTPKVLILRTAGTNCDLVETDMAFQFAGAETSISSHPTPYIRPTSILPTTKSLRFLVDFPTAMTLQRVFCWRLR